MGYPCHSWGVVGVPAPCSPASSATAGVLHSTDLPTATPSSRFERRRAGPAATLYRPGLRGGDREPWAAASRDGGLQAGRQRWHCRSPAQILPVTGRWCSTARSPRTAPPRVGVAPGKNAATRTAPSGTWTWSAGGQRSGRMASAGNTTQRGYGRAHQVERAKWEPIVETGQAWCWRCGCWLDPTEPWDLGHDDHDRNVYRGPECVPCNRGTAAARGNRSRGLAPIVRMLSL